MVGLLNGDFENWNHGTLITPLTNGVQLADDWFWNSGSHSSSFSDVTRTGAAHTGSFAIDLESTGAQFVSNTDTYIYQDISNYTDYIGLVANFSAWGECFAADGIDALAIFVDDGITTTFSSNSTNISYTLLSVSHLVSGSATRLRVGLIPTIRHGTPDYLWDTATLTTTAPLTLTLSDSVASSDSTVKEDEKVLADSITLTDNIPGFAKGQNVSDSLTIADSFSAQSNFLAPAPTPLVEALTNLVIPAEVKTYYKIQE